MLDALGVSLAGLFLHENHVTSQAHAAFCDSLALRYICFSLVT